LAAYEAELEQLNIEGEEAKKRVQEIAAKKAAMQAKIDALKSQQ
jgi:hypothetical protein